MIKKKTAPKKVAVEKTAAPTKKTETKKAAKTVAAKKKDDKAAAVQLDAGNGGGNRCRRAAVSIYRNLQWCPNIPVNYCKAIAQSVPIITSNQVPLCTFLFLNRGV